MIFLRHVLIAALILVVLALLGHNDGMSPYFFAAVVACGELWIFANAWWLRTKGLVSFDMLVAAEILIAYGIFSLLLGLFIALNEVRSAGQLTIDEAFRRLLPPFAGGLFGTGLATLLAAILRQAEVLLYSTSGSGGISLDGGAVALGRAASAAEKLATAMEAGAAASSKLTTSLTQADEETQKLGGALGTAKSQTDTLAEASGRLNHSMRDGQTLLDGTAKLIESVNRFLRTGTD